MDQKRMKIKLGKDKIIKISIFLIVLFILIATLIFGSSTKFHQIIDENNSVNKCGFSNGSYLSLFEGNLIVNHFFSYPYYAVNLKVQDYFSLKEYQPIFFFDMNKTVIENNQQYYSNIIRAGNQSRYYSAILKEFQKTKISYNLDDDEYLQLIVNFVQSMPYFTTNSNVKYPFVTFADGCGDCDDKSLLLLALLSQENYNVSIFIIPPEGTSNFSHAMAGVASNSATFTKNGYAMIETTKKESAIGTFPSNVASEKVLVIRIGNGTKTYETHSSIWILEDSQYRVVKKGNTTISITPYYQNFKVTDLFKKQMENFDWNNDCKNGQLPNFICIYATQ
jgi:hypothetical protein